DLLEVRASIPMAVERRHVFGVTVLAHRQPVALAEFHECAVQSLTAMCVVVRIEVGWPASSEGVEAGELVLERFDADRGGGRYISLAHGGGKIRVQPNAEPWQLRTDRCCLRAEGSVYQQARAGDDALAVGL